LLFELWFVAGFGVFAVGFVAFAFVLGGLGGGDLITCVGVLYLRVFSVDLVGFCCLFAYVLVCWVGWVGWVGGVGLWACGTFGVFMFCFIGCVWFAILVGGVGLFGGGLVLQLLRVLCLLPVGLV